jgi:hypothetical protein
MATFFTILFALLGLTALISGLVLYAQFRRSPEQRWRAEVLRLLGDAERRARAERQEVRRLAADHDGEARALRQGAFRAYLGDISVEQLAAFPGIGPATVAKLRDAGYANLARLHNARIRLSGLGPKRLADIDRAVADLLRQADHTFAAGRCEQAGQLADDLTRLRDRYDRLRAWAEARARAADEVSDRLNEPAAAARRVTFWRWFRPISDVPLLPQEVLESPLPDLEEALRATDEPPMAVRAVSQPAPRSTPKARVVPVARAAHPGPAAHHREEDMPDETHLILMDLTLQFAFGVARADGPVSAPERALIHEHVRQRFAYNRALLNRAEAHCAHYESAAIDLARCLDQVRQRFTPSHRAALMTFAASIVAVSGPAGLQAMDYLNALAKQLDVPPAPLPATPAPPPPPATSPAPRRPAAPARVVAAAAPSRPMAATPPAPPSPPPRPTPPAVKLPAHDDWLAALEIPATSPLSADLVRRQYHLLAQRLAPEKVAALGPEFVTMAEAKRAAVRRAAEALLAPLGEALEAKAAAPPADLRHNPDLDEVFGGM